MRLLREIANALNFPLIAAEAQRAELSSEPASIDWYFQGMAWINKGLRPDWLDQAQSCFDKALSIDNANLEAHVGVAMVETLRGVVCATDSSISAFQSAERILTEVLSSVPYHAWAHCLMAAVLISTRRPDGALWSASEHSASIRVWQAHMPCRFAKYLIGKGEETECHVEEALRLSPLDSFAYLWMLFAGVAKIQADQYETAATWLRRSIEINTNSPWAHFHLGVALYLMGSLPEAKAETSTGLQLDPSFTTDRYRSFALSDDHRYLAIRERTIQALQASGVP